MSHDLHTVSKVPGAPKWSFAGRYGSNSMKPSSALNPGPGAYSFQHISGVGSNEFASAKFKKSPGYSWSHKARDNNYNINSTGGNNRLGPGSYNIQTEFSRPTSAKGNTSLAPRMVNNGGFNPASRSANPGPGSYDISVTRVGKLGAGPSFTMGAKRGGKMSVGTPGPGAYSPDPSYTGKSRNGVTMNRTIQPQFSKSRRDGVGSANGTNKMTPGPGAYDTAHASSSIKPRSPQFTLGGGGRRDQRRSSTPGPGAHESNYTLFPSQN